MRRKPFAIFLAVSAAVTHGCATSGAKVDVETCLTFVSEDTFTCHRDSDGQVITLPVNQGMDCSSKAGGDGYGKAFANDYICLPKDDFFNVIERKR